MKAKVTLGRKRGYRVEAGHPWVYDNEIETGGNNLQPGQVVDVYNFKNRFIGSGIANPKSHILVRLFTRNPNEEVNADLIVKRLEQAWAYRRTIGYTENCRLVFSEADFLPGLIVDKFGDVLVLQIQSFAIEIFRDVILDTLNKLLHPRGIYERNDAPVREREGLPIHKGYLSQPFDTLVTITEPDGVKFLVDVKEGQKTGFFLDQKENRRAIKDFVKAQDVLDCFCYTGSFAMYAAQYGAKRVTALDQSESAIEMTRRNAELNGVSERCEFLAENAFDVLNAWAKEKRQFDVVLLDPPAFTKTRANIEGALRGYKDINLRAMQIVKPGGFLVTSSCSHFIHPQLFHDVIFEAALDAHKTVRQIVYQTQAKDHPVLWGVDESLYLKFLILQVL